MPVVAVDLDDEALVGPAEVDHVAVDGDVALGLGEAFVSDEGQEAVLELGLGPGGGAGEGFEGRGEGLDAVPAA